MSYVGGPFKHDVFVSYSQGDADGTGESRLKQWSQAFVRELRAELREYPELRPDLSLFLDESKRPGEGIDPLAKVTPELREAARASAMLLILMSPHYLRSKWCAKEREWWQENLAVPALGLDGRLAVAWIWPVPKDAELPALVLDEQKQPTIGFRFFDTANAATRPQPYEWPEPSANSKGLFRERLLDVVGAVQARLAKIKDFAAESERRNAEKTKLIEGQRTVYLHARKSEEKAWVEANDALSNAGFIVLPGAPDLPERDPAALEEQRHNRVSTLKECDALLLLRSKNGHSLDSDLITVGRHDRNSARAFSNRSLPCAVLDRIEITETPQRRRVAERLNVEWLDVTGDPWVRKVENWLVSKGKELT